MGFVLVVGIFFFFFKAVSHHLFCTWRVAAQQAKVASEARYLESRECGGNSGQVKSRRGQRGGGCATRSSKIMASSCVRQLGTNVLRRIASYSGIVGGTQQLGKRSFSAAKGDSILEAQEHATGLEKAEKDGLARGVNIFTEGEAWLQAPFGTPEKPVVVTSSFSERIVGVTDPEDDSIVVWDFIRQGEPPKQIIENGEYFVLKKIDNPEDHFVPHSWP